MAQGAEGIADGTIGAVNAIEAGADHKKSSYLEIPNGLQINAVHDPSLRSSDMSQHVNSNEFVPHSAQSPREASPDTSGLKSSMSPVHSVLKNSTSSEPRLTSGKTVDQSSRGLQAQDLPDGEGHANGTASPNAGRKSVQFSRDTEDLEQREGLQATPPSNTGDRGDSSKAQSLYSRLRALATSQNFSHARTTSNTSMGGRSVETKDLDGHTSVSNGIPERGLAATLEEDDSEADGDADAEESAAEGIPDQFKERKSRRKIRRYDDVESAPTSPHSPMHLGLTSSTVHSDHERPTILPRRATDTDMANGRQGMSEDEGRAQMIQSSSWIPRHPLRGLSYGGQRKTSEGTPEGREGRRPLTLLNFSNAASSREGGTTDTPKTSRRKLISERGTTLSAAKWKQIKNSLRLIGQSKKRERSQDHEKSAELLAELAAGSPAALMLASMFQRDEHDNKRIPVLLEQLKVQVTDSEVEKFRDADIATAGDRHMIFKIELEYGNGINRMKWVVKRSLRDFANLHLKYKFHYSSEKLKGRGDGNKEMPKFPKSAFPYLKAFSGMDDEEDEDDEPINDQDTAITDNERPTPKIKSRSSFAITRRKSSGAGFQDATSSGGGVKRDARYAEKQRKKLEVYLQRMIKFMLFRADSNRLCKFLEVSAMGVRLAAEGSYHGKEGFLLIRSAKGLDFRKALTPAHVKSRHAPKWFLVRHSYVVCVDSPEEMHIYDVFLFDSDFSVQSSKTRSKDQSRAQELTKAAKESAKHPQHHRLKLGNSERKLKLLARNERQLHQFEDSIQLMLKTSLWTKENRFGSFAPVRPNCFAQWLVDGRDHMWVLSRALNQAKDVIYIHDWWLSPELYMRRPPAISQKWRLDRLLKRKAEEGVKIFVIVYRNIESAVPIDSSYTKFSLLDLHPNVFVQRSPNQFRQNTFFWAHHEKICIVDHTLAFVGGIDLCFGRWDTPQHTLIDDKATGFEPSEEPKDADHCQLWPGKDYSNPRIQDFYALNKPYEEMYDRQKIARMPWHDISMQVIGQPARDLTRHFVQRWNYILRQRKPTRPTPFLLPPPDFSSAELEALGLDGTCEVQILRSSGAWSMGTPDRTEHSIMNAYIKMIEESEHFVYIENQFFISSCETEVATVHNKIGDALVERITRAAKNDEAWRACIIIPLIPGFQNTVEQEGGTSVRLIMQYQYRSICRGESSIFGRLRAIGIEPEDYIQFYALRQWGRIGPRKALLSEQLYIHAKCMVVDDRIAIIGSANVNERSMLGNRDSECAAVIRDTDMLWSRMNGKPYQVGRFPHTLRMRLMREHLGLDVDKIMEDAQAMESEHHKAEAEGGVSESRPGSAGTSDNDPMSLKADVVDTRDDPGQPLREELLERSEKLRSFNHDADWEQKDNPNLKANRKLTEDPRVTGNATHRQDVEGGGLDKMTEHEELGRGGGRDTVLVKGNKEVLVSDLNTEGKKSVQAPRGHGEVARLPSYVAKLEMPNPPLPPKPPMDRTTTSELGLPMLSQLPELPLEDDTDIGGPPLIRPQSRDSTRHHPLFNEIKRPLVDRDCMMDPVHDAFMYDTWHAIAENNTKIYRSVFRCMPDNQVRDWNEYHQYVAYEQRFAHLQGNDMPLEHKSTHFSRTGSVSKSGPPGAGSRDPIAQLKAVSKVPTDLEKRSNDIKDFVKGAFGDKGKEDQAKEEMEKLRVWAAQANQAQAERQRKPLHRQESYIDEKTGLETVPEDTQGDQPTSERTSEDGASTVPSPNSPTAAPIDREKTSNSQFVTYSEAINQNGASGSQVKRRRRRGTTMSSRREFSASDDILSVDEAEELLGCIQGHLVVWPYDWLEKVEAGSNWLFPFDQISPIEIYI